MTIYNDEIPEGTPRARDPHHGGDCEWCFYRDRFWHRHGIQKKWTKVERVHPTPARMKLLAELSVEVK